jgi:ABC-2 type transport system permease protein
MVMLKGAGFHDIKNQLAIIALYAFVIYAFAVWSYKKSNYIYFSST